MHVPTVREAKWLRFARSVFGALPAVTVRYSRVSRKVLATIADLIEDCETSNRRVCMIIEDSPSACILPDIRKRFPNLHVAVRSENLLTQAFADFAARGSLVQRLPWKIEVRKIMRFEKAVCLSADRLWAITKAEAEEYEKRLSIRPHGVVGVSMDAGHYSEVNSGAHNTVVHVGRADLRKGRGLTDFIKQAWPAIRLRVPDARLVLGGQGTGRFADRRLGIEGLGFVEDDRDVLGQGLIFLNPQRIGAGLQVKSVVAMLAGKALVSTRMAIEGVEGRDGEHFFVADSPEEMIERIVGLIDNSGLAERAGQSARALAARVYSHDYMARTARPLIEEFAALGARIE